MSGNDTPASKFVLTHVDLLFALVKMWRLRAGVLTGQAVRQRRKHDAVRLTAMATALESAATDLLFQAQRMRNEEKSGWQIPLRPRRRTAKTKN